MGDGAVKGTAGAVLRPVRGSSSPLRRQLAGYGSGISCHRCPPSDHAAFFLCPGTRRLGEGAVCHRPAAAGRRCRPQAGQRSHGSQSHPLRAHSLEATGPGHPFKLDPHRLLAAPGCSTEQHRRRRGARGGRGIAWPRMPTTPGPCRASRAGPHRPCTPRRVWAAERPTCLPACRAPSRCWRKR